MKTPRQILMEQHQNISARLDRVRQEVVAGLPANVQDRSRAENEPPGRESISFLTKMWLELFVPARKIWVGLATVWVAVFIVSATSTEETAGGSPQPAHVNFVQSFQRHTQIMAQALDSGDVIPPATPTFQVRPRSEIPLRRRDAFVPATLQFNFV